MNLYQRIESDMKAALKEGDSIKLSVVRMVISAVKTFAIEKNIKQPEETDILQIIQRQIKQHKESIESFEKGKRQDLADKEARELKILEAYMPQQLSEEELLVLIKEAISETGATSKSEVGRVMKIVMEKVKGRSDGKTVNQLVMRLLNPSTGSGFNPE